MTNIGIFQNVLERIGGEGAYQSTNLVIWSIILFFGGSTSFFNAFLFYQNQYSCQGLNISLSKKDCHEYVCTLPELQRSSFINNETTSLSSKFGDYRCQGKDELNFLQSFSYFGGIAGVLLGVLLIQIMTKKKVIILTLVSNFIGLILTVIGPNILVASFGLFINLAAKCCQIEVIVCYIVESVDEKLRGIHIMITYSVFAVGAITNGLLFKLFYHWEYVLLLYLCTLIVALFGLILYTEEAPRDLILSYPPEKSLQVLKKIAYINNREHLHNITLKELQNIKVQYQENQKQKHDYSLSVSDLFRYDSLRMHSILLILLHFLMNFQFVAPQLALEDYELNIYLNGMIIGTSELIASLITCIMVNAFERKKVIYATQCLSLIVTILLLTVFKCNTEEQSCSPNLKIIQSIGISIFRFSSTIGYNFYYLVQSQVFPSQIKGIAVQTTAVSKHLAYVSVPWIMYLCTKINSSIITAFALSCILVAVFIVKVPETFEVSPPEMIQQLQYQHHEVEADDKAKIL